MSPSAEYGYVSENVGCPNLCILDDSRQPQQAWIAVVQRGNCSFVDKVREAQRLGAHGVVVGGAAHNPEGGDSLVTMYNTGAWAGGRALVLEMC